MYLLILNNRFFRIELFLILLMGSAMANRKDKFPPEEYEHYMELIKEIDPEVNKKLRDCQDMLWSPCIKNALDTEPGIDRGSLKTQGYPIMFIKSMKDLSDDSQKVILKTYTDKYNVLPIIPQITNKERKKFLEGVKAVDHTLYDEITERDPMGIWHIKRDYLGSNMAVSIQGDDGLPLFFIDHTVVDKPWNELLFGIAHELSHYVLGHTGEGYLSRHQSRHPMLAREETLIQEIKKGKKVAGLLPFKETFEKARDRIKENEADRMAVIEFGVSIDDAIAAAKWFVEREGEIQHPHKETFKRTHPMWLSRIKHLESLRNEVELNKEHKVQRKPIDWRQLAERSRKLYRQLEKEHRKIGQEQSEEELEEPEESEEQGE